MSLRRLALALPFIALVAAAVVFRTRPAVVDACVVAGFVLFAAGAPVVLRRRLRVRPQRAPRPPASRAAPTNARALLDPLQAAIVLSRSSAVDYERHVRPVLFRVTMSRLRARGLTPDAPGKVEALLGPQVWQRIRPAEMRPDRDAPGVSLKELEEIVTRIEEV